MSFTITSKTTRTNQVQNQSAKLDDKQPQLTAEQLKRMEENRLKALKLKQMNSAANAATTNSSLKVMTIDQMNLANENSKNTSKPLSNQSTSSAPSASSDIKNLFFTC